jgi:ubiquinone/menaquinone biosynthesis C-methylase UbiE
MAEISVAFHAASQYERFMGRWSRAIGEQFLDWLAPPKNARWLDAGCGTGAFSELIMRRCAPSSLIGTDPAPAQIEYARKAFPELNFRVDDTMAMSLPDNDFDIVATALVIHFIPDRAKAFAEMKRVTLRGGLIAGYLWKRTATDEFAPYSPLNRRIAHIGGEVIRSALVAESSPNGLRAAAERAGYRDIDVIEIKAAQTFRDFDNFWEAQTPSFHPVSKSIAKLTDEKRHQLRDHMRAILPTAVDGSITFPAQSVAFKAFK